MNGRFQETGIDDIEVFDKWPALSQKAIKAVIREEMAAGMANRKYLRFGIEKTRRFNLREHFAGALPTRRYITDTLHSGLKLYEIDAFIP